MTRQLNSHGSFRRARAVKTILVNNAQIANIVELLEAIRHRPGMYFGNVELARVEGFLFGFEMACPTLGHSFPHGLKWKIVEERRWQWPARGLSLSGFLEERGLSDAQIVDELLAVEIECWKRALQVQSDGHADGVAVQNAS